MFRHIWVAGLGLALLAGCSDSGSGGGTGALSLGVTDAPVDDADAVVVGFSAVELLDADGGVALRFDFDEIQTVDLLEQQGDNQFFLIQDEQIPSGVYEEVRLIVAEQSNASCNAAQANPNRPSYITVDGVDYPLIVPSGAQTGLKVRGPLTIAAGGSAAYTVDFDLRKSIAERGATGCYNLRPVLRVVDNAEVGTLTGSVDPALLADSSCTADPVSGAGAAVYVYSGSGVTPDDFDGTDPEPLTTALLQPEMLDGALVDFSYEVGFLLEGNYTVALSCQAGDDLPAPSDDDIVFIQPGDVEIIRDTVSEFDFAVIDEEVPVETTE
ncbi:DUF4382 domain-containing protein [Polycyclovorans algicola]|uniref:DUF4382 domain-containing protein n=1 Tax=Polycyclovorans algicola TaxID=616992 RepID=UPI000AE4CE16|nr:DUF4382 domain-containing protein [Polycyclovorans algicola]